MSETQQTRVRSRRGSYRDRVTIKQDSSAAGDPNPDFSGAAFLTDWPCRHWDVSGQATFRGLQISEQMTSVIEMDQWSGGKVTPGMRAIYDGRMMFIMAAPERRGPGTTKVFLMCREEQ